MASRKPKSRQAIKEHVLSFNPTEEYKYSRSNFWGETMVLGLPPWRLLSGRMMLDSDPLITFSHNVRNAALMASEIEIKCKNPVIYNWIEEQWNYAWNFHRTKMTSAKKFGFAALQVDWKMKNGLMVIKTIKDFAPEDVRCLQLNNKTVGWTVKSNKGFFPQALWLTFNAEYGNPYGLGCLRRQYPSWYEKWMDHGAKRLLQLRMIKDAYIGDIFWYPPNLNITLPDGTKMSWKDLVREMAENRLSGGAMTLPMIYDENGKELTKYAPPQDIGGGSQIYEWNDLVDRGILQGADVPIEVVEASQTGSGYSGRSIPFLAMLAVCNSELSDILRCFDECCLRPAAWLNWGGDVDYEIKPKNLVETFSDDVQGSPMGGEGVGTSATAGAPQPNTNSPPQIQGPPQNVQFAEDIKFFKKGEELAASLGGENLSPKELVEMGRAYYGSEQFAEEKHRTALKEYGWTNNVSKDLYENKDLPRGHTIQLKPGGIFFHKRMNRDYLGSGHVHELPAYLKKIHSKSHQFGEHSYGCLMLMLEPPLLGEVLVQALSILPDDLRGSPHGNQSEKGVEFEPHITVKYGIHTGDADVVRRVIQDQSPIAVTIGKCSYFEGEENDVVKLDVEGQMLHDLNKHVCDNLDCTDTFPDYKPHITLAYVKPGLGKYYSNRLNALQGKVIAFDRVTFSDQDGHYTTIPLTGQNQFAEGNVGFEDRALHAPPGGVNIHGVQYKGGEFIPKEVIAELAPEDKQALRAGSIARHIKSRPELAAPPNKQEKVAKNPERTFNQEGSKKAVAELEKKMPPLNPAGKDTESKYMTKEGAWSPERQKLHASILQEFASQIKPQEAPEYLMMGGGTAAGKSSIIKSGKVTLPEGHVMVNADEVKEKIPEYHAMSVNWDPLAAAYTHEESSYLAKKVMAQTLKGKGHLVLDGTGDASIEGLKQKCDQARAAGHKVRGEYVTCPTQMSLDRSKARGDKTGRYVPEEVLKATHRGVSKLLPVAMKEGFFDEVNLWDTSGGGAPVLVASGKGKEMVIHDQELWGNFLKKAEE